MPTSTTGKIKLSGFDQRSGKPATASTNPARPRTHASQPSGPAATGRAATTSSATATSKTAATAATSSTKAGSQTASLLPGGPWLWCLMGLAIGLSVWLGGRSYLRATLATQLAEAETEQAALQSIDALLRLDADASIEVSRSLAHPEFMVANAAFRALGGQLDAWAKLEPDERLRRMQQVITELDRIPPDIDQDHRILITGLTSRIYADALSNREEGAALLLDGCRRILARAEPNLAATRIARLEQIAPGPNVLRRDQSDAFSDEQTDSPVPPPLPAIQHDEPASDTSSRRISDPSIESETTTSALPSTSPRTPENASPSAVSMPRMRVGESSAGGRATVQLTASPSTAGTPPPAAALNEPASIQLSQDASSRSRIIPQNVLPIPDNSQALADEQAAVTLSGIDELSIDQLVRLLPSLQPRVSQAAALTLRRRGMSEQNLNLAMQLATGSAELRQELLTELVTRADLDPRPWLLWMAADGQEAVREQAVGLLSPLIDNDVRRQLRLLLNKESDERVAQTIRRVLVAQ